MKTLRTNQGPFTERPYFKPEEIEKICTEELKKTGLMPSEPSPIRIDLFIEKRFNVTPTYEQLPENVLGYSKFSARGLEAMVISRQLAEEGTEVSERRHTTTLAHEAGHCLLHAYLFAVQDLSVPLFGEVDDDKRVKVLCRSESADASAQKRYDGKWWEYQANCAIGPLLLPKLLVMRSLETFLVSDGSLGCKTLPSGSRQKAIVMLADTFNVNKVVAKIRIDQLIPNHMERQLML